MVEQRTFNPQVQGSIPWRPTARAQPSHYAPLAPIVATPAGPILDPTHTGITTSDPMGYTAKNQQPPRIRTAVTRRIQPGHRTNNRTRRHRHRLRVPASADGRRLARQPAEARRLDAATDANLDSLGFISNQEDAE